ncbi:DUF4224 domain-containing protein [Salinisphaera dokdonensis]|uniref:DUF4224 domain-containing protein n=1 Tax=Salinisphaera dokdonensis TaxID=454598 RepID=UPI0033421FE5
MTLYPQPLLSDEDLAELTGYEPNQIQRQMRWLKENGVAFTLRRDGRPRTTWGAYERAMASAGSASSEPNFDALRARATKHQARG